MAAEFGPGLTPAAQAAVDRLLQQQAPPRPTETRQPGHRTERAVAPTREVPEPTPQPAFSEKGWDERLASAGRAADRMAVEEQPEQAEPAAAPAELSEEEKQQLEKIKARWAEQDADAKQLRAKIEASRLRALPGRAYNRAMGTLREPLADPRAEARMLDTRVGRALLLSSQRRFSDAGKALKGVPLEQIAQERLEQQTLPAVSEEELEAEIQARLTEREQLLLPELEQQLRPEIEAMIRQELEEERLVREEARGAARESGEQRMRAAHTQLIDLARQNPNALKPLLTEWLAEEPEGAEPRPSTRLVSIPSDLPENVREAFARTASLPNHQKAAILIVGLGPDLNAPILKGLPDEQIERLALEIFKLGTVDETITDAIFFETYEQSSAEAAGLGGEAVAKEMLTRAFGEQKAQRFLKSAQAKVAEGPFSFLVDVDPSTVVNMLMPEHPQTVALVLSHLPPTKTAEVLSGLPPSIQADIAERIGFMHPTQPEVVKEVETQLKQKLGKIAPVPMTRAGGIPHLVRILNNLDEATERTILETLEEQNPELAEEVRKNLFVFEDIGRLTPHDMTILWRYLNQRQVALALKGASPELKEKFLTAQSSRNRDALLDEMDQLGPVPVGQVYEAQDEIINVIRRLQQTEDIVIPRGSEEFIEEKPREIKRAAPSEDPIQRILETSPDPLQQLTDSYGERYAQGVFQDYRTREIELIAREEGVSREEATQHFEQALRARRGTRAIAPTQPATGAPPTADQPDQGRRMWPFWSRGGPEPPDTGTVPQ